MNLEIVLPLIPYISNHPHFLTHQTQTPKNFPTLPRPTFFNPTVPHLKHSRYAIKMKIDHLNEVKWRQNSRE